MNKRFSTITLTLCALFTALTAIGAFIQIPVPGMDYFTLQTLFVLLAGMLLGSKLGALSVTVYVLIGLAGVPIFAAGGGITYVVRPSFGYLLGFIAGAFVTGFIAEKLHARLLRHYLLATYAGLLVIYVIGIAYKYLMLNLYVGEKTALVMVFLDCFPLDLPGDLVLSLIGATLSVRLRPALASIVPTLNKDR